MLLSVVIPIFNSEPWLDDCLTSVLNQPFNEEEMEIICVNDGSTDKSLDIIKDYQKKDGRIRVISKENGGLASALNCGLDSIKGEYVLLVNSDDFIDGQSLRKITDYMQLNDIDIFHGATEETPYEAHYCRDNNLTDIEIVSSDSFAAPGDGGMTVYKSSLINKNGCRWDKNAGACAEWLFYDAVAEKAKKIVFSKYPTYYHRAVDCSLGKSRTVASTKRRMDSLLYLAEKYKNEFHYSVAYRMAVQSYLMDALALYNNKELKQEILPLLRSKGLYPYRLIWRNLKPVKTASQFKLKLTLVNIAMFLFPCKSYYLLFARIFRKKRSVK